MNNLMVIIILNYFYYNDTIDTVNNLINIGVQDDIVIVDNNSPNESYQKLLSQFSDFENISIIKSPKNGGYSYGNNYGIKYALEKKDYEFICILNPDVIVPENYFSALCERIRNNEKYSAISPIMLSPDRVDFSYIGGNIIPSKLFVLESSKIYVRYLYNKKNKYSVYNYAGNGLIESERLPGSFFIIKSNDFFRVGLFDEEMFMYGEENVLAIKLKNINKTCVIDLKYYYIHNHRSNISSKEETWKKYAEKFDELIENQKKCNLTREIICKKYYNGLTVDRKNGNIFNAYQKSHSASEK